MSWYETIGVVLGCALILAFIIFTWHASEEIGWRKGYEQAQRDARKSGVDSRRDTAPD